MMSMLLLVALLAAAEARPKGGLTTRLSAIVALREFYESQQPRKMQSLQKALDNFAGREELLREKIAKKYSTTLLASPRTRETILRVVHFFVHAVGDPNRVAAALRTHDIKTIVPKLERDFGISVPGINSVLSERYTCSQRFYDMRSPSILRAPAQQPHSIIPAIIFQTHMSRKEIPAEFASWAQHARELNPSFKYIWFDDADIHDFITMYYPQYVGFYHSFPKAIMGIDFFRLLAVYQFGGFYFDMDVKLTRPLEPLRGYGCVFPIEMSDTAKFFALTGQNKPFIGQYAFGCTAGHPFLRALIENIVSGRMDAFASAPGIGSHDVVLLKTGPGMVTFTLHEYGDQAASSVRLLGHRLPFRFGDFGQHFMAGTWREQPPKQCERLRKPASSCIAEYGWGNDHLYSPECKRAVIAFSRCTEPFLPKGQG